eukprot:scaffold7795_cov38-Phaeocystis_antarctica.AAC.1
MPERRLERDWEHQLTGALQAPREASTGSFQAPRAPDRAYGTCGARSHRALRTGSGPQSARPARQVGVREN